MCRECEACLNQIVSITPKEADDLRRLLCVWGHIEAALFEQFKKYFPRLAELVVFRELATPLATALITGHAKGSFYGLDVTPKREWSDALRMKTPIKGLYLTGQDVLSPGVPGALWGGLLCATSIDPKVLMHFGG